MKNSGLVVKPILLNDNLESIFSLWESWQENSTSPEPAYQSAKFFRFIHHFSNEHDTPCLFGVWNNGTDELVGVLPLRNGPFSITIHLGRFTFKTPKKMLNASLLLGSNALMKPGYHADTELLTQAIDQLPKTNLLVMQAAKYNDWNSVSANHSALKKSHLASHLLYGWRNCHYLELPENFATYEQQFGKKKRYNLNRQIRLLREHGNGNLELCRVNSSVHLNELMDAITRLKLEASFVSLEKLRFLAAEKLLLAYILKCNGIPCGLIVGALTKRTFTLQSIQTNKIFDNFSPGASILHLAIEDMINCFKVTRIDMGYGTPKHRNSSCNSTEQRGYLVIARKKTTAQLILMAIQATHKLIDFIKQRMVLKY